MIYRLSSMPPSVNKMYGLNKGRGRARFITEEYAEWIKRSVKELNPVIPLKTKKYELHIHLPKNMRGDLDNRCKAISDLLVKVGATPDDKHMVKLVMTKTTEIGVEIEVVGV